MEWLDAYTIDDWTPIDDLHGEGDGKPCFTTGYLIHQWDDGVCVASTISEDGEACQTIFIPKGCIKRIKKEKS